MDRTKSSALAGAREFFSGELKSVMERQHFSARAESFDYLVNLMLHYMESESFFVKGDDGKLENNVLADLYRQYLEGTLEAKKLALKRLGDVCLLISGFFADSLKRKLVDIDYYHGMGGLAYYQLSQMQVTAVRPVYAELAAKFRRFSDVLGEMSERSGLQSNSDLLRLYERWLFTGSERLRQLLSEHGIATPFPTDTKMKH